MSETIRVEVYPRSTREIEELEYEVYVNAGYILPDKIRRVRENDDYPEHNIVAVYCDDLLVGSVRLVVDSHPEDSLFSLRCFEHFDIWPWARRLLCEAPANRLMQVGTMVIREEYRSGFVFQAMFKRALEMLLHERIHFAVATIDEGLYNRLGSRKIPFVPMGETIHYMGSRTVPALVSREWLISGVVPDDILSISEFYSNKTRAALHSA